MIRAASVLALVACGAAALAQERASSTAADLQAAITDLGSFEFNIRTDAARRLRRAPVEAVVPALAEAVRAHRNEYSRYRALVILSGFGGTPTAQAMRAAVADRNDRLRTVAFTWYGYHPDPAVLPVLLAALEAERSEFVRPALTRALAAQGGDARARAAIVPLIDRGDDFFRGAVIAALGDHKGTYALAEIAAVARLDGPLQDDAVSAIGKLGDRSMVPVLAALQRSGPRELQPTIAASLCLLGQNCDAAERYLKETIAFSAANEAFQPLLRGAAHALGMLAVRGREAALTALLDAGAGIKDPARSPIALAVGLVAIRQPQVLMGALEARPDRVPAVELLRDAFDMLSEDFEEERFFVDVRKAYWAAADGSPRRQVAQLLLEMLEF